MIRFNILTQMVLYNINAYNISIHIANVAIHAIQAFGQNGKCLSLTYYSLMG